MSMASAPTSAAPYLYRFWRPRRSAGSSSFPMFALSPFFSSVLSCSFLRVASYFALFFLVSPFLLLLPAAVATAADGLVQCRDPPTDGTIVPSCSLASRKSFGSFTSASLSPVLCEEEVNGLPEYYAVVVDSGSTGTRAFVYKVRLEPGSCGEIQQSPGEKGEGRTVEGVGLENGGETEATAGLFHPLGRAIVQVPAIATRRIGPGITLFAKRETGRKKTSDDAVDIENMTEESMRRELLEDEHLVLESEQAEEERRRAQKRLTSRRRKEGGGGRAAAAAVTAKAETAADAAVAADEAGASERYGRQEDVEESLEKYLGELRDFVLTVVPTAARKEERAFLFFRGTAGMRTLSQEQQHKLLDRIRASLATWGLQLPPGAAGASVLSGAEEGVLGWVALNQLLGNFPRRDALLNFAAGHHHFCSLRQQQQQEQHRQHEQQQQQPPERQQQQEGEERGGESQKQAVAAEDHVRRGGEGSVSSSSSRRRNSGENDQGSNDNSLSASSASVAPRAGLVEMGGASAQVVLQLPAEARAANLLRNPYLENPYSSSSFSPPSLSSRGNDGTSATTAEEDNAEQEQQQQQGGRGEQQRQQQRRQQRQQQNRGKASTVRTVEPSERIFESGETRQYPPVRRHRGPYVAEDFFEVDLCRSRHIVYSKSFLGLGRQHALMQHIHDSVSEAMEKRRREIEEREGPLPTAGNPVEATVPCLPADVRVHVKASSAATAAFDEDFSKIVQEEQQDIEEHAAAAAAAEEVEISQQQRQQRSRRSRRGSSFSSSNSGRKGLAAEEQEGGREQRRERLMNGKKKSSTSLFAAAGAASPPEKMGRYEDSDTGTRAETGDEEEQADGDDDDDQEEEKEGEEEQVKKDGKQAKWKKLPRPGVARSFQKDDELQLLLKKNEANVLQQIESVAAQGTSDGTACMHKMAQTMMRVGRVPFEIHRDMQLYATENFYHFNEYVLQANGKPDFTVDLFSREGRKLCFLQQVKEVHKHLHPGAAREKAQTACFGLMFMSEFLRRVVGLERNRVLRAVNDLHDVEVSWTAAVPMLYMPHVLVHAETYRRREEAAAAAAAPAPAAAASVETVGVPAEGASTERAVAKEEEDQAAAAVAHASEKDKEAAGKAAEVAVEKGGVKLQRQHQHAQRGAQGGREEAAPRTSSLAESLKTSHDEL